MGLVVGFGGCTSTLPVDSKGIELDVNSSEPLWYGYTLVSEDPLGAGFRLSTRKDCETWSQRPGLSLSLNKHQAGSYQALSDFELRDYFSEKNLAQLYLSAPLNPFSNNEDLYARFSGGTILVEPLEKSPAQEPGKLPKWDSIRITIAATIDPQHFRPYECSIVSPKNSTIADMGCSCRNAEAKVKTCSMQYDESKVDESNPPDERCCNQFNTHTPDPVTVRGTFTAKYCPNLCGSINPPLIQKLCPDYPLPDGQQR